MRPSRESPQRVIPSRPSPALGCTRHSAKSRRGILSWALKRQRPPTSWRPLPGLRSENELGDHAELTKLVVVLNTKTMRGSAIGSEGCFAHG